MAHKSVAERIRSFNDGREPERLKRKYKAMRKGPFPFFRGTCHLFYEDLPRRAPLSRAPSTWICGDLHLENFGTYRGDNRLVYFDVNDFDEAVLAPCTWDVARLLTSTIVATSRCRHSRQEIKVACHTFLDAYCAALRTGKALWVEPETASGIVKVLFDGLQQRSRAQLLAGHTQLWRGGRRLLMNKRTLPISRGDRKRVTRLMRQFAKHQPQPRFFTVRDVARRVAGTGSLGVERYVILVEGNGSPGKNFLLDLKAAAPSALERYVSAPQPKWPTPAQRIVAIENRLQAVSAALLQVVKIDKQAFVLRELQPMEDKLDLAGKELQPKSLISALNTMGAVTAWAHLRGSGRQGAAVADQLIELGSSKGWQREVLEYAWQYARRVERDQKEFRQAWSDGFFASQLSASRSGR